MSRNPIFRKCARCDEITEHWRISLDSYGKEGWACGVCDKLRDMKSIHEPDIIGAGLETVPIEAALHTEGEIREEKR